MDTQRGYKTRHYYNVLIEDCPKNNPEHLLTCSVSLMTTVFAAGEETTLLTIDNFLQLNQLPTALRALHTITKKAPHDRVTYHIGTDIAILYGLGRNPYTLETLDKFELSVGPMTIYLLDKSIVADLLKDITDFFGRLVAINEEYVKHCKENMINGKGITYKKSYYNKYVYGKDPLMK